jgi:hypothetical protein
VDLGPPCGASAGCSSSFVLPLGFRSRCFGHCPDDASGLRRASAAPHTFGCRGRLRRPGSGGQTRSSAPVVGLARARRRHGSSGSGQVSSPPQEPPRSPLASGRCRLFNRAGRAADTAPLGRLQNTFLTTAARSLNGDCQGLRRLRCPVLDSSGEPGICPRLGSMGYPRLDIGSHWLAPWP